MKGDDVNGWVERHGIRFFELRAKLSGRSNAKDAQKIYNHIFANGVNDVYYNFKYFPSPDWNTFDYNPRLVKEEVEVHQKFMEIGEAEVILISSQYDPWIELDVVRVLGAVYTRSDFSMLKANVIAEVDPEQFAPYSYLKNDI